MVQVNDDSEDFGFRLTFLLTAVICLRILNFWGEGHEIFDLNFDLKLSVRIHEN